MCVLGQPKEYALLMNDTFQLHRATARGDLAPMRRLLQVAALSRHTPSRADPPHPLPAVRCCSLPPPVTHAIGAS